MKQQLRSLFAFILKPLEAGDAPFSYKPSHRTILILMSCLFAGLAMVTLWLNQARDLGYLLPTVVFGLVGLTGLIVGLLGNDRAVAKLWGSR